MTDLGQSGAPRPEPIKLPIPPGKAVLFDHIKGGVRIVDILDAFGGWGNLGITPDWRR